MDEQQQAALRDRQDAAYSLYAEGLSYTDIALRLGIVSGSAARSVVAAGARRAGNPNYEYEAWKASKRRKRYWFVWHARLCITLGRPIDMGGPRDVWLERSPWDEL